MSLESEVKAKEDKDFFYMTGLSNLDFIDNDAVPMYRTDLTNNKK